MALWHHAGSTPRPTGTDCTPPCICTCGNVVLLCMCHHRPSFASLEARLKALRPSASMHIMAPAPPSPPHTAHHYQNLSTVTAQLPTPEPESHPAQASLDHDYENVLPPAPIDHAPVHSPHDSPVLASPHDSPVPPFAHGTNVLALPVPDYPASDASEDETEGPHHDYVNMPTYDTQALTMVQPTEPVIASIQPESVLGFKAPRRTSRQFSPPPPPRALTPVLLPSSDAAEFVEIHTNAASDWLAPTGGGVLRKQTSLRRPSPPPEHHDRASPSPVSSRSISPALNASHTAASSVVAGSDEFLGLPPTAPPWQPDALSTPTAQETDEALQRDLPDSRSEPPQAYETVTNHASEGRSPLNIDDETLPPSVQDDLDTTPEWQPVPSSQDLGAPFETSMPAMPQDFGDDWINEQEHTVTLNSADGEVADMYTDTAEASVEAPKSAGKLEEPAPLAALVEFKPQYQGFDIAAEENERHSEAPAPAQELNQGQVFNVVADDSNGAYISVVLAAPAPASASILEPELFHAFPNTPRLATAEVATSYLTVELQTEPSSSQSQHEIEPPSPPPAEEERSDQQIKPPPDEPAAGLAPWADEESQNATDLLF